MSEPIIKVNNLDVEFKTDDQTIKALDKINLDVQKNEFICIMGISGCGKTTLLNAIAGFIEPNHGEILLKGNKIEGPGPDRAVVFGSYYLNYNFKKATFQSINVPKYDNTFENQTFKYLPVSTEFDKEYLREALTWDDTVEWKGQCTMAIRLHNFMVFKEAIEKAEYYVYSHDYILKQILSNNMYELLMSLDKMVKSNNPRIIFEKYKPLYKKLSNTNSNEVDIIENKFF